MNATDFPLAFADSGQGTPALVLLHAFPFDRTMWQMQFAALAAEVRVIVVDLPGFGESKAAPFTVDSAADQVATVLDTLGIARAVVGGLSMGGYVAMAFARRHADRLAGLILADTKSDADDEPARQNRDKTLALVKEKGTAAAIDSMLPKLLGDDARTNRPEVADAVRRIAVRQSSAAVQHAILALRDRPDATTGLTAIVVPTLIVVGEHDAITPPAAAEAMVSRIPGCRLATIPGAGHLSNLENGEAFTAAVRDFLKTDIVNAAS